MPLENDFESLIASFLENNVGVSEHFLSNELAGHLKLNLLSLLQHKLLHAAGTGNADKLLLNKAVRNDSIYWLDKKHEDEYENEFHYSIYEIGGFYKKHLDRFQNNSSRKYSMISYLNEDWKEEDGGQLLIHQTENDQKIDPTGGKTVFFKSDELAHEVLVTHQRRMSVTGWLKSN